MPRAIFITEIIYHIIYVKVKGNKENDDRRERQKILIKKNAYTVYARKGEKIMKKENNNTNIKNQEEKVMRKEIKLEKFTDEESFYYQDKLPELYEKREKFVKEFIKQFVDGEYKNSEMYQALSPYRNEMNGAKLSMRAIRIKQLDGMFAAAEVMVDYMTEFATTARAWNEIFTFAANDDIHRMIQLYNEIKLMVRQGTFAPDGKYQIIKIPYQEYKAKAEIANHSTLMMQRCGRKPANMHVKTGRYDAETKEIEVYIPESYAFKNVTEWIHNHMAGDLDEMVAEMAKENRVQEEKEMKKEMMIETVENTYDMVGAARTINNYTGISDDEFESDYVEYIVEHLFGDDESQEQKNKEKLVEYYSEQPEGFFKDFDSEDLVIRMGEDLIKIEYDELVKRYGFKKLSYAPYDPEYATNETDYNWEMLLQLAMTKCEIIKSMPVLEDAVRSKKISEENFRKLINMYKKCGFGDWSIVAEMPDSIAKAIIEGHETEDIIDFIINNSVIRGE